MACPWLRPRGDLCPIVFCGPSPKCPSGNHSARETGPDSDEVGYHRGHQGLIFRSRPARISRLAYPQLRQARYGVLDRLPRLDVFSEGGTCLMGASSLNEFFVR